MIKAIIFDFDGVILQSASLKTEAFAEIVKDYPQTQANAFVEYHKSHMGISRYVKFRYFVEEILHQPYTAEIEQQLGDAFTHITFEKIMSCPFVPGAKELLQRQAKKRALFIASGTPLSELKQIIRKRELKDYFQGIYGSPEKKETIIEQILARNSLTPQEALFVGDALSDKRAAQKTGLPFVGILTEENKKDFQDITWKIQNLLEVESVLKKLEEKK